MDLLKVNELKPPSILEFDLWAGVVASVSAIRLSSLNPKKI